MFIKAAYYVKFSFSKHMFKLENKNNDYIYKLNENIDAYEGIQIY